MGLSKNSNSQKAPEWQIWGSAAMGAFLAMIVAHTTEAGADKLLVEAGQKFGFALGWGLGIGLLMWLIFYFPILRRTSGMAKIAVFAAIAAAATLKVMLQIG